MNRIAAGDRQAVRPTAAPSPASWSSPVRKGADRVFAFFTALVGYGYAVILGSALFSGFFSMLNLLYLIPIASLFFDFTSDWIRLLMVCFAIPFPTSFILYGIFSRLGIPPLLPSFRTVNRHITGGKKTALADGLDAARYLEILRALNRIPLIILTVATIEVAYIDIVVLVYAVYSHFSLPTIGWIFFSWFWQTVIYAGVGYVLAESVTGVMRRECKRKLRALGVQHETPVRSSMKLKLFILLSMVLCTMVISVAMTYYRREHFTQVLTYLTIYSSVIILISYIIIRTFYFALFNAGRVVEALRDRGEGVIFASTIDREIVELSHGINSASDIITDYRVNLERKVDEKTRDLTAAKEEIEAAMTELEAVNDSIIRINRELEDANRLYRRDLMMAGNVQNAFLPDGTAGIENYDVAFIYRPIIEVSGDFYDFYIDGNSLNGVGLFDVSGHGISSGLLTLLARSIVFRNFRASEGSKLHRVMNDINHELIGEIGQSGLFITGLLLRFRGDMVEYVNAGHPQMICRRHGSGRTVPVVPPGQEYFIGPLLGIKDMEEDYKSLSVKMSAGDLLLVYTDALAETENGSREYYGLERILQSLQEAPDGSAAEMLDHIIGKFHGFAGRELIRDDLTIILLKKR